ncbi:hypothetical protein [Pseudonocardia sp. T1-2H]|uniref:hypothetical protein n=1 Tax=Pseudonocardia sp. T1-2H TaxID=3128899 RepID=UPI00310176CF
MQRQLDRTAARAMAYGRIRTLARLETGRFQPHPGWRHFIDTGWRVLTCQREALQHIKDLVDGEDWRTDKRTSWLQILCRLVHHMDWNTGLVTGLTAVQLGSAGARATRTVSRVLAWARDAGLLVVIECGASAEFLGARRNRTPSYALVSNRPLPPHPTDQPHASTPVDESGDLPMSYVSSKPLQGGRRPTPPASRNWPVFQVPQSPSERTAATLCFLQRIGLGHREVSAVPLWRTRALLKTWWDAGACVAGLLYALDHHPDRPGDHRGDARRGATDPLRVLGYRLRPWTRRLDELPAAVVGIRGDYRHRLGHVSTPVTEGTEQPQALPDTRAAARATVDAHLRALRKRRQKRTNPGLARSHSSDRK